MGKRFELYIIDLIKGRHSGVLPSILRFFLLIFSLIYQTVITFRNWAFDQGWLGRYYPPVPVVISIGNIVAGGTGKTPVTMMIAREFLNQCLVAILSRGYRSTVEHFCEPIILCSGKGPLHPPDYCGDEPYIIAENLPKTMVIVGKNRHKASNIAAKAGAQIILLDDGMQHRHVARDFEVIVMNAGDLFGQGYFLPRGFLRERISSLARADLIILNHIKDLDHYNDVKQKIAHLTKAPLIGMQMEIDEILDLEGKVIKGIHGMKVGICCGIANPDYFAETVQKLGANVIDKYIIPDHMNFETETLIKFSSSCQQRGCEMMLCTEKDKIKLSNSLKLALPIGWLRMKLEIVEGLSEWKIFIDKAKMELSSKL
jgi:tetraacyldisaccharide 4'-kinase